MAESLAARIRAAISDSYYDARNDGLTMEHAADQATAKVMEIVGESTVVYLTTEDERGEDPTWVQRLAQDEAAYRRRNR